MSFRTFTPKAAIHHVVFGAGNLGIRGAFLHLAPEVTATVSDGRRRFHPQSGDGVSGCYPKPLSGVDLTCRVGPDASSAAPFDD
jgi:hypothetical protein